MGPGDEAGWGPERPWDGSPRGPKELDVRGLETDTRPGVAAVGRGLGFWDGAAPTSGLRRCQQWINRMYSQESLSWEAWELDRGLPGPAGSLDKPSPAQPPAPGGPPEPWQHLPGAQTPALKRNPLYRADAAGDAPSRAAVDALSPLARVPPRTQPAWTLEEFTRRALPSGAQPPPAMQRALRPSQQPERLEFWLEDVSTPGYEALLRRKERQHRWCRSLRRAALVLAALGALGLLAGLGVIAVKFWVKL